jgi:Protein of unknown function (DUF3617)
VICFLACVLVAAYAYAQTLELRTGQWAFTMSGVTGYLGNTSELPAEERAQIEEQMRQPHDYESCLTDEDLQELNFGESDDDDCEVTARNTTANSADVTRECSGEDARTETIHIEAASPESMKVTIKSVMTKGTANVTISGKWIGTTCKEEN